MMTIGGALGIAGRKPLGDFVWGETIIGICNGHLEDDNLITPEDTGNEALIKVIALPDDIQIKLMSTHLGTLITDYHKSNISILRFVFVALAIAMALISLMVTFQVDTEGFAEEEKADLIVSLFKAMQLLLQTVSGM